MENLIFLSNCKHLVWIYLQSCSVPFYFLGSPHSHRRFRERQVICSVLVNLLPSSSCEIEQRTLPSLVRAPRSPQNLPKTRPLYNVESQACCWNSAQLLEEDLSSQWENIASLRPVTDHSHGRTLSVKLISFVHKEIAVCIQSSSLELFHTILYPTLLPIPLFPPTHLFHLNPTVIFLSKSIFVMNHRTKDVRVGRDFKDHLIQYSHFSWINEGLRHEVFHLDIHYYYWIVAEPRATSWVPNL